MRDGQINALKSMSELREMIGQQVWKHSSDPYGPTLAGVVRDVDDHGGLIVIADDGSRLRWSPRDVVRHPSNA